MTKCKRKVADSYLRNDGIILDEDYIHDDVPFATEMSHEKWKNNLITMANEQAWKVLELGSRAITNKDGLKKYFTTSEYIGFDYYEGPSVDIVGDAHHLSDYFDVETFDLVFSSAVFEHLALPWVVAEEIAKVLKIGGYLFIETHYCYNSHARPWHFFQFSEKALQVLFSRELGFQCIEAGVSTPIVSRFSNLVAPHLRSLPITGMYCHSELFAQKIARAKDFNWRNVDFLSIVSSNEYPDPELSRELHH